ncbi:MULTISPECIES: glycoside hydrolase family 43 protein [unclassified Parabacteroides]|uniref:glycoside hydrolase family 43 protein n=1 Tax=unclassified Parabacteroides TaxID=2649774 RepID=UPI002476799B|nr:MULTISPECIES: glycoside hydrolase family 43 protein [unclassified Parabacteroides]
MSLLFALSSCLPQNKVKEGTASFDYFTYSGEDDFYKENPLTKDNQFYNPILPGWYSDPSICRSGGDYFMVTSTFSYYPGVPLFHSTDLVNWKQIGHVLDRPSQLSKLEGQHVSGGVFAPAISYNPHNKTFYMITTDVGSGNFFVKTQDPFDSWSEPIYLPEVGGIDPSFFFDEDGRAYIVNNDGMDGKELYDGHRSIRIHEFDVANDCTIGRTKMIVNGGTDLSKKPIWIEGPHMYKINGSYYLMAAEGGTGPQHSEVIFRSDNPMGPFIPWDKNPILTQRHLPDERPNPITCTGHADLIQAAEGDWWAVFLACRPIDNTFENLGRETFIIPVQWTEDGWPMMTKGDETVPMILERKGVKREEPATFGNFVAHDEFETSTLAMEWMSLRGEASGLYSLTENQGALSLKCAPISVTERKTSAYIARRMQHHKFECTTRMQFNPENEKQAAGILLYKNEDNHYFLSLSKAAEGFELSLTQVDRSGEKRLASTPVNYKRDIELKVVSTGTSYSFYYSLNKGEWTSLIKDVDASLLSTAKAGGFTGSTIGMYAVTR